jgi:hypothetical protein
MNSKKLFAGVIALAIAGAIVAPSAQAATAEELAAQINALQTQLQSLQGQLGTGSTASGVANTNIAACAGVTFTRNLTLGSDGNDVKCLQAILNSNDATAVAATGVGSAGSETTYFGGLTRAAVIKFQDLNAAHILTPVGLTSGTGFVGASTRAELNELLAGTVEVGGNTGNTTFPAGCTSDAGYSTVTGLPCTTVSTLPVGCTSTTGFSPVTGQSCSATTVGGGVSQTGAEGAISVSINPSPANGVKLYEGDSKVSVFGIKIKATGSDVDVQRTTLRFSAQPYSYFTNLYLYDGDTQIATSALTSDTVSKVSTTDYEITLSGFTSKVIVARDATKVLTAKLDVLPGISSGLLTSGTVNINVGMPSTTAIRAVDQAGLNQYNGVMYTGDATTYRTFSVNESQAANATLTASLNSSSPKARNVVADSSEQISGAVVAAFDLKATKDNLLIDSIEHVQFALGVNTPSTGAYSSASSTVTTNTYITPATVYLVDDGGNIIGTGTPAAVGAFTEVAFSDLNYTISKDTTKTFTIKVDDTLGAVSGASSTDDGSRYRVAVFGEKINFEKSNGATGTGTGTANGNDAIVYAQGPVFTVAGITTSSTQGAFSGASSTISATFNIQVQAVTGDVWVPKSQAFAIKHNTNGTFVDATTSTTYVQPSGTTDGTNAYKVSEGTSATFAVSATLSNVGVGAGTFALRMDSIKWGHTDLLYNGTGIVTSIYMAGDSNWISSSVYLQ